MQRILIQNKRNKAPDMKKIESAILSTVYILNFKIILMINNLFRKKSCFSNSVMHILKIGNQNNLRRPGVKPGSTVWETAMLTVTPPTH